MFVTTFIPVPRKPLDVSFVRSSIPGVRVQQNIVPVRNFCEYCTPVPQCKGVVDVLYNVRGIIGSYVISSYRYQELLCLVKNWGTIPGTRICFCYNPRGASNLSRLNSKSVLRNLTTHCQPQILKAEQQCITYNESLYLLFMIVSFFLGHA